MTNQPERVFDYRYAVATEFATRPSLRQLIARQALDVLGAAHALVADTGMPNAESLVLLIPTQNHWRRQPLVDALLDAFLQGVPLERLGSEGGEFMILASEPYPFKDAQAVILDEAVSIAQQMAALDAEVQMLIETFCQAQVDYWAAPGRFGASRDRWLQLTIKSALLHNLPLQDLDAQQTACVHDVFKRSAARPTVFAVEVELTCEGLQQRVVSPNLLIQGEYDERLVLLWCAPSSRVRAFDSIDAFARALRDELAEHYRFDTLTWHRYILEGDPFAQQGALILEGLLQAIQHAHTWRSADPLVLDKLFTRLSDPASLFIEGYAVAPSSALQLPPGFQRVTPADGFACQEALFELALAQAESAGVTSRDQIMDVHGYARQQLRQALMEDHPDDANYFPDDLLLTLTRSYGVPGGPAAGPGDGAVETKEISLTDYAIGRLGTFHGASPPALRHRGDQLIMPWLTLDYVDALVSRIDIGGRYPGYVARLMDAPEGRAERIDRFAREWRSALLASALEAKLAGILDASALQCVIDYCRGEIDPLLPAVMLMPLAFTSEASAAEVDEVRGMYVLFCAEPHHVLLYRPLYPKAPLMAFTDLDALMAAIGTPGELQTSVLDWLPDQARRVYDNGGFLEPHPLQPIIDDAGFLLPVKPATLHARFWRNDVDARLYQANRDLMLELADRQSISNAEQRWALLVEGAWLLFDVVSLVLRGPAATVAWLAQGIAALGQDLPLLTQGTARERSAAVVDLIINLGLAVAHLRLPHGHPVQASRVESPAGAAPLARSDQTLVRSDAVPLAGQVEAPQALAVRSDTVLAFSWRGSQGYNALTSEQRTRLEGMRCAVNLRDVPEQAGLYTVEGQTYVTMSGDVYQVDVSTGGVRIVGASGEQGPWLERRFGAWRVDSALRLRGGIPKSRVELRREQNRARLKAVTEQEAALTTRRNALRETFGAHRRLLEAKEEQIRALEAIEHPDDLQARELALLKDLCKRIRETAVYDIKALIDSGLEHDPLMTQLFELRHADASMDELIKGHRQMIRQELIEYCKTFYNELAALINEESARDLNDAIAILPEGEAEIEQYKRFRATLERVVKWESDAADVAVHFDCLLEATLNDPTITFKDAETGATTEKVAYLKDVIEQRKLNAVDLEVRLLLDVGELCIDRLAGSDEGTLRAIQSYLAGDALHSAGAAHGDLASSELGLDERLSVLTSVLDAYEEAAAAADYLGSTEAAVIRLDALERHRRVLGRLRELAEQELEQAVREKELATPRTHRPVVYASRGGKRRVVKTQRGRSVVGTEVEIDGVSVVQQRDNRTDQVLKTFKRQGSQWLEDVREAQEPGEPVLKPEALRQRGRTLVDEVESVIRLARRYVKSDEPHGLSSVIDLHVDKLVEVQGKLARTEQDAALHVELADGIERLQATRQDLLVGLYLATSHPTANSLRFLVEHGVVHVERAGPRRRLSDHDYLDVYEIRRQPAVGQTKGSGLWEAHFHYPDETTPAHAFSKGHLKLWSQRKLGREAQLRAAATGRDLLAIYRGDLKPEDIVGLIPFE